MLIQRQGAVRPFRSARTWLTATSILASGLAAPAFAQNAEPPPYLNADSNGVDLVTGKLGFSLTEGSVGTGENEISLQRILVQSVGWTDNWSGKLRRDVSGGSAKVLIEFGAVSNLFTLSGTVATPAKADGSSLVAGAYGAYTFTARDGTVFAYETQDDDAPIYLGGCAPGGNTNRLCGIPVSITKPNGAQFTLEWEMHRECNFDADGDCASERAFARLAAISSRSGNRVEFLYDPAAEGGSSDWLQRKGARFIAAGEICDTNCRTVTYTRGSAGGASILTVADPMSNQWRFTSSATSFGIRRPGSASDDVTVAFTTDRVVSSVIRDAITTNYARTVSGSTATMTITNALSQSSVATADLTKGRVTSFKNPLNETTAYQFDTSGRVTRVTFPEGNYIGYAYDSRGNVTQTTRVDKAGLTSNNIITSASYSLTCSNAKVCNQPNSTTDARGNVTDYTYDLSHGGVLSVTAPAPATGATRPQTRYGYSPVAGITLLTGVSHCQTSSSCVGTADEAKSTIAYDSEHKLVSVTQAAGDGSVSATTAYGYDVVGNVTSIDGPLAGAADTMRVRYNALRQVVGMAGPDPDGSAALKHRASRTTYNATGQVVKRETGTVTSQSDSDWAAFTPLQAIETSYDIHSRPVVQKLTSGGTTYQLAQLSYDALGRTECVAQRMNPAEFSGLPSSACQPDAEGTAGPDRIVKTHYDAIGRAKRTESAVGTSYQADEAAITFTANGRIATVTDGKGNKTTYEYDSHDRLKKTLYPDAMLVGSSSTSNYEELSYDAGSNVTNVRLRDGQSIGLGYDKLSRVTTKNLPGTNPDISYSYDLVGRLIGATEVGGQALSFGYDALNRTISAGANLGTLTYQYDPAGRRTRITHPDGFYAQYDHLVTGEVSAIRENGATSGAGVLATFTYDNRGRRLLLSRGNGTKTTYSHDAVARMASLGHDFGGATNDVSFGFSYDPASGLASRSRDNDSYAYPAFANTNRTDVLNGLNQTTTSGSTNLTHDARGNITAVGATNYSYDIENRMTAGGLATAIHYDPLGRLRQVTSTNPHSFLWDGNDLALEYMNGQIQRRYVHGPNMDEPLVAYNGSGTTDRRWLHADERGSVIAISDGIGNAALINRYDEYGVPASGNGGRFGYTGQVLLPEVGLYYFKARVYNPNLGRFMQPDPIGYADGLNLYAYVKGDPVNKVDPTGTDEICWESGGGVYTEPDGTVVITAGREQCVSIRNGDPSPRFVSLDGGGGSGLELPDFEDIFWPLIDAASDFFCSIPPIEISAGADTYLGVGASASLGVSFDIRTFQVRGSVSTNIGAGYGGGLGVGLGAGDEVAGVTQQNTLTGGYGPFSVTTPLDWPASPSGSVGALGPRFGGWAARNIKYTSPPTPNVTGACKR